MDLQLNTGDIQAASQQLKTKAGDMEAAIADAERAISPLRGFRSPRISRDLETWDSLRNNFKSALEALLAAGEELAKAAMDNEAANR